MNLPLHLGFLGALEAGLIAFVVGLLCFLLWQWLCRKMAWSVGHVIGWACVTAVLISAGIDTWNLFYLGMMKLESPLYARLALQGIHDADALGARVICELTGALSGVAMGWQWFSRKKREDDAVHDDQKTPS
jgi:hypothetical protein